MKQFKSILCVVDSLAKWQPAFDRAADLAGQNGAQLTVVDVVDDRDSWLGLQRSYDEVLRQDRSNRLQELINPLRQRGDNVSAELLHGRPAIEITRTVVQRGIELVVKDARGTTGQKTLLIGSTDMRLLRNCPSPVWLVMTNQTKAHARVLLAVDPQAEDEEHRSMNERIIDLAASVAEAEVADLHVVAAWNAPGEALFAGRIPDDRLCEYIDDARANAQQEIERLLAKVGMTLDDERVRFRKGEAPDVILDFIRQIDCDLLVMGTVAQTGIESFLMGNTADTVLRQIGCSVLTVKPDSFVSPVKG